MNKSATYKTLITSKDELIRLFYESGGQMSVNVSYDIFKELNSDDYHQTVMSKASFVTCGEHLDSLTPEQRNDDAKMMNLTRIFEAKYADLLRCRKDFDEYDDDNEDYGDYYGDYYCDYEHVDDETLFKSMIKNHPFLFASKKLLNDKGFLREALCFSHKDVVCSVWKHVIPWWVQKKTWYMAYVHKAYYTMGEKMEKEGVFSNRKKALEMVSIYNDGIFLFKQYNPGMYMDVAFWKGVSNMNMHRPQRQNCFDMMPSELKERADLADVVSNLTSK